MVQAIEAKPKAAPAAKPPTLAIDFGNRNVFITDGKKTHNLKSVKRPRPASVMPSKKPRGKITTTYIQSLEAEQNQVWELGERAGHDPEADYTLYKTKPEIARHFLMGLLNFYPKLSEADLVVIDSFPQRNFQAYYQALHGNHIWNAPGIENRQVTIDKVTVVEEGLGPVRRYLTEVGIDPNYPLTAVYNGGCGTFDVAVYDDHGQLIPNTKDNFDKSGAVSLTTIINRVLRDNGVINFSMQNEQIFNLLENGYKIRQRGQEPIDVEHLLVAAAKEWLMAQHKRAMARLTPIQDKLGKIVLTGGLACLFREIYKDDEWFYVTPEPLTDNITWLLR